MQLDIFLNSCRDLTLSRDHSVARYLARCYPALGLYGKNALQASEVSQMFITSQVRVAYMYCTLKADSRYTCTSG